MNSKDTEEDRLKELHWNMLNIKYVFGSKYDKVTQEIADAYPKKGILHGYDEKPTNYNNKKCSIYKFCSEHNLNPWEFDIIKQIMSIRKEGHFKKDLDKIKILIDLYLLEYEHYDKSIEKEIISAEDLYDQLISKTKTP